MPGRWTIGAMMAAAAGAFAAPLPARTILFVGNSFTQGAYSPVRNYRAGTVRDLMRTGYGGVPALFKQFADEARLPYDVSLETQGGEALQFHYEQRRALIERAWDVVVLQDFSTLSRLRPGDPADHVRYAGLLAVAVKRANPAADIYLDATWTRADETYRPSGRWYGRPVTAMADDLRRAADLAARASPDIRAVIPIGEAWNAAFQGGVADPNPYDGVAYDRVNLWSYDNYHASTAGYYLEALVVFARITRYDPRLLGGNEAAADALGLSPALAVRLQEIAHATVLAR